MQITQEDQVRRHLKGRFTKKRPSSLIGRSELNRQVAEIAKSCGIPTSDTPEVEKLYLEEATTCLGGKRVTVC